MTAVGVGPLAVTVGVDRGLAPAAGAQLHLEGGSDVGGSHLTGRDIGIFTAGCCLLGNSSTVLKLEVFYSSLISFD